MSLKSAGTSASVLDVIISDMNVDMSLCQVQSKQMINNALHLLNALFKDE